MKEDKDNRENQEPQVRGLSQKRDAVYKPLDMAMAKKRFDIGKRSTLAEKSAPSRQNYLEELKRDLDEITDKLLVEGVQKFASAFDNLLQSLEARRAALQPS